MVLGTHLAHQEKNLLENSQNALSDMPILSMEDLNGELRSPRASKQLESIIHKTVISALLQGLYINECGILNDWVGEAKF